jgi:hypothetical protein
MRLDDGEEWSAVLDAIHGLIPEKDWNDFNPDDYRYTQLDAVLTELSDPSAP